MRNHRCAIGLGPAGLCLTQLAGLRDPRELIAVDLDDARLEIIGTEGTIYIQGTGAALAVSDREGWHCPDTTYWPMLHDVRSGALREELAYFANCILGNQAPAIIAPKSPWLLSGRA